MPKPSADLLTDQHIAAIGALVVAVSKLESILLDMMSLVTGMGIVAALITVHHQQFSSKVDTLLALLRLGNTEGEPENPVIPLITQAREIADFRNTLVHAHWTVDAKGIAYAVRFEARGKFVRKKRPVDAQEIRARAEEGNALAQQLADLRDHLHQALREKGDPS